ncbi:MAG: hypothetical protein M1818_002006 [Claussenomyces sp. TS43310]|nr:MAG: hypothetical protein M1818_002006 [Claussenomyces sp. TS43310]
MEHRRHILPSNYPPQGSLDSHRQRQPLTDATGNAQYQNLDSTGYYHDQKGPPPRMEHGHHRFSLPTLPSQPHQPLATALELRRAQTRRNRATRSRNPIVESPQYQLYRDRQIKNDDGDQKWSQELEEAFLDALCDIPRMGRRKFSLNGKPHGRNELISLYLWISYVQSLPPGVQPDRSKERTRKQVSSHIQVLKGFMRGHPQFEQLFPSKDTPKNGFEDSFKNDPCLRALAQNRLPRNRHHHQQHQHQHQQQEFVPSMGAPSPRHRPIAPTFFQMCMTYPRSDEVRDEQLRDDKNVITMHHYCWPPLKTSGAHEHLESLAGWRVKFPLLAQAQAVGDLKCDIIHIDISLAIRNGRMPDGSELWGQFEILVPTGSNSDDDLRSTWRCTQTMCKPADLYGPSSNDPKYENVGGIVSVEKFEPGVGSHMRVPFPANTWAYALVKLSEMEEQCDEAAREGRPLPTTLSARQYIDQISMYQEVFCCASPNAPWKRRAIILWTFEKSRSDDKGEASWRYLDPAPPRRACFSPHPGPAHVVSAAMTDNFNAWADAPPLQIQAPAPFDPLLQGLATPPQSAVLHSPYPSYGAYGGPHPGAGAPPPPAPPSSHDLNAENLSFISHETGDSDSTLVESQHTAGSGKYMDTFLAAAAANGPVHLGDFDHAAHGGWLAPPVDVGFDGDSSFLVNYGAVPSNAPQVWDGGGDPKQQQQQQAWDGGDLSYASYESHHHLGQRVIK